MQTIALGSRLLVEHTKPVLNQVRENLACWSHLCTSLCWAHWLVDAQRGWLQVMATASTCIRTTKSFRWLQMCMSCWSSETSLSGQVTRWSPDSMVQAVTCQQSSKMHGQKIRSLSEAIHRTSATQVACGRASRLSLIIGMQHLYAHLGSMLIFRLTVYISSTQPLGTIYFAQFSVVVFFTMC